MIVFNSYHAIITPFVGDSINTDKDKNFVHVAPDSFSGAHLI